MLFLSLVWCLKYFKLTWCAQVNSFARSRLPLDWSRCFLSNTTSPSKVTTLSSALASILSCKIEASLLLGEIPNLRFEHVVGCSDKYNRGLVDCCDWFIMWSFPVHRAVSMTILADVELKLVSCFSNLIYLPIDHSVRLICSWKSCPCWICVVPSNSTVSEKKKEQVWIDCNPMTGALYCTNVNNRFVLVLVKLHFGFVVTTTECVNQIFFVPRFEFAQSLPWVSKHVSIVLLRQLHDNLRVVRYSWSAENAFEFTILLCFALAGSTFQSRWLNPIDVGFGLGTALYWWKFTARGRPQLDDSGENTAPEFGCSGLVRITVVSTVQFLVIYAPKTSNFLAVVTVLALL